MSSSAFWLSKSLSRGKAEAGTVPVTLLGLKVNSEDTRFYVPVYCHAPHTATSSQAFPGHLYASEELGPPEKTPDLQGCQLNLNVKYTAKAILVKVCTMHCLRHTYTKIVIYLKF